MSNLSNAQIAININFSGLYGARAAWSTAQDVAAAYLYAEDDTVSSLDLARALSRGVRVLRSEGRNIEADEVAWKYAQLQEEGIFSVNDMMDLYIEEHGTAAATSQF